MHGGCAVHVAQLHRRHRGAMHGTAESERSMVECDELHGIIDGGLPVHRLDRMGPGALMHGDATVGDAELQRCDGA